MIKLITALAATLALTAPAMAQDAAAGDAAKGQKEFNKCKACHTLTDPSGTDIVKGGKTGPNLYGVIGREVASVPDFKYGDGILALKAKYPGAVWDTEAVADYITGPTEYLDKETGDPKLKSKMTFKMAKNQQDVVAFLLQNSPEAPAQAPDGNPAPVMPGAAAPAAAAPAAAPAAAAPAAAPAPAAN